MLKKMQNQVENLQKTIVEALEQEDTIQFQRDRWERPGGGGGLTMVLENGTTFEKAGVNTSTVFGQSHQHENTHFSATGISIVIHPRNPMVPTTHANYRYFELTFPDRKTWWFGGGADLTPYYLYEEDAHHFHSCHKKACDATDSRNYPKFKAECDQYFYLPHRQEARGIGGIFFDYVDDKDPEILRQFSLNCANAFLEAYRPIVQKRKNQPYTERAKHWQHFRRGRYAEFNLLFDRGTKFGIETNGRIESILMSLPPSLNWHYKDLEPTESGEIDLIKVLRSPREWV
jgi:coproporphyrinogen III oxidase